MVYPEHDRKECALTAEIAATLAALNKPENRGMVYHEETTTLYLTSNATESAQTSTRLRREENKFLH